MMGRRLRWHEGPFLSWTVWPTSSLCSHKVLEQGVNCRTTLGQGVADWEGQGGGHPTHSSPVSQGFRKVLGNEMRLVSCGFK